VTEQSAGQLHSFSPGSQIELPQNSQSSGQVTVVSPQLQLPSGQLAPQSAGQVQVSSEGEQQLSPQSSPQSDMQVQ
jgi:hypothetical protein